MPDLEKYFLGFDGGATKTGGIVLNSSKEVVAEEIGKPGNFQIVGVEQASKNILDVAEAMLGKLGAEFSQVKTMYLGLAGAGRKNDAERMLECFVDLLASKRYEIPKVQVGSDALAALEGAFGGKPGMILICGTGSILFAKAGNETIHRVGGWGRFIGDEGSGYALGRSCLTAVARELDSRGKKTLMTELLKNKKGIDTPESLISAVYRNNFDIASAAPIVIEAAEKGDDVALEIVNVSTDDLTLHISAILGKIEGLTPLVLAGSILSSANMFSQTFRKKMADRFPRVKIMDPEYPPAVGAALLAFKMGEK